MISRLCMFVRMAFDATLGYPGEGPKRGRKPGKKRRAGQSPWRDRFAGFTDAYNLQQTTSGTGGFSSTAIASTSISSANSIYLDCYTVGGRLETMSSMFGQYRINKFGVRYTPFVSDSGVVPTPGGANTTPSYGHRTFALLCLADPAFSLATYAGLVSAGAKTFQTNRKGFYTFASPDRSWKYCSTTVSSPSLIDQRQASFGVMCVSFEDSSTAGTTTYGSFTLVYDVSFRIPMLGGTVSIARVSPSEDSKEQLPESLADIVMVQDEVKKEAPSKNVGVVPPKPTGRK